MELELTSSMIGILQNKSLMPETKLDEPKASLELRKHREMPKKGGATSNFTLEKLGHLRQHANKAAIGQQQALTTQVKSKKKKLDQTGAANKLRPWAKTRIIDEIQLALLHPKSLEQNTAQEISFRVVLTWSLMNKWQLQTIRFKEAQPQETILGQLRKLGLDQCSLNTQLVLGDHLFVMLDGTSLLIGGQDQMQECFLNELSAIMPLDSTTKLADDTPLTFLDRTVELDQAEKSISLRVPLASLQQLLEQHGITDAQSIGSLEELYSEASSLPSHSLDAEKAKLHKRTVGILIRMASARPDAAFAIRQLCGSLTRPTEKDDVQLNKVLGYLRRTQAYAIKLQPPRRVTRAKSFDLLAFASTSWIQARNSAFGVCLFLMGVPLAASSNIQATGVRAAELSSVGLACQIAAHTKLLLQQLGFVKPMNLQVLTGGSIAMQLGLSKHQRHVQLDSCFGQFQLSKVRFNKDLASKLTYNLPACELHWLLPKLRMHNKIADARALPPVLCEKEAFFVGRPCSFYIGAVSFPPNMEELGLEQLEQTVSKQLTLTAYARQLDQDELERIELNQLEDDKLERIDLEKLERMALEKLQPSYVSQLLGKEPVEHTNLPELESLQRKELVKMTATLNKLELDKADSSLELSANNGIALRRIDEIQDKPSALLKPDEGRRALGDAPSRFELEQLQLLNREIDFNLAFSEQDQLSLSGGASEALAVVTKSSSANSTKRTSISLSSTLLFIFFILMISIFPSKSLENSFDNNFIHCCAFQLVEQDELSTTFGQEELGKKNEFHTTFLWDQELEELLVDKSFPLDPLHGHLGKENLWSVQLQQNILENDEQKELEDLELEEKNIDKSFQKKIFLKKLDALLLEWHFAKAASHQPYGIKAWEKHREASKEIGLNKKKGDKELPYKLRRQELGYKRPLASFFLGTLPDQLRRAQLH